MKELLDEAMGKHRHIKKEMMLILEKISSKNYSKETLKEEIFKLYMELK